MLLSFPTQESLLRKLKECDESEIYIVIANFKSFAGWNLIPLSAMSILLGPNSAGKSAVYDVINVLRQLSWSLERRLGAMSLELDLDRFSRSDGSTPIVGFSCPYDIAEWASNKKVEWDSSAAAELWNENVLAYLLETTRTDFSKDLVEEVFHGNFPFLSSLAKNNQLRNHLESNRYTVLINELAKKDWLSDMTIFFRDVEVANWRGEANIQTAHIRHNGVEAFLKDYVSTPFLMEDFSLHFNSLVDSSDEIKPSIDLGEFPYYLYTAYHGAYSQSTGEYLDFSDEETEREHVVGLLTMLFHIPILGFLSWVRGEATEDIRSLTSAWSFVTPDRYSYLNSMPELAAQNSFTSKTSQNPSAKLLMNKEVSFLQDELVAMPSEGATDPTLLPYEGNVFVGRHPSNKQSDYLKKINVWLASPAFLDTRYQLFVQVKECATLGGFEKDNDYLGTDTEYLARLYLRDEEGRPLTFANVGTGFSQALPVLIDLAYDRSVLYKQPEVHLHPKLQSRIADCFVEQVNTSRNRVKRRIRLIETHSEHFVLRILRRLRDSFQDELLHSSLTVYPQDFALVYFKPVGNATEVYEIRVSKEGNFIDSWPDGFFDERDEDLWGSAT